MKQSKRLELAYLINKTIHKDYELWSSHNNDSIDWEKKYKEEGIVQQRPCYNGYTLLCDICFNENVLWPLEVIIGLRETVWEENAMTGEVINDDDWLEFRKIIYYKVNHCEQSMEFIKDEGEE